MSESREVQYEQVEPLVVEKSFDRRDVQCVFECPVSGDRFEGEGYVDPEHDLQTRVQTSFLRKMGYRVAQWLGDLVHSLTGSRIMEEVADSLAYEAAEVAEEGSGIAFSEEAEREAVVLAFEDVKNEFIWDSEAGRWISAQ